MHKTNCKKMLSLILALCMLLPVVPMMTLTASAKVGTVYTDKTLYLRYIVLTEGASGNTVSIGSFNTDYQPSGALNIPTSVELKGITYEITEINSEAFRNDKNLTSITIPNTIKKIGTFAFSNCPNLTTITVAADNPYFSAENGALFNKDKTVLIAYPTAKGDYVVPSTVHTIYDSAFSLCSELTSVTIPDSVTEIQKSAFYCCDKLTKVELGANVNYIGPAAFTERDRKKGVDFANVTFKGVLPGMHKDSFLNINITEIDDETKYDPNVSVDIVGYKNGKTYDEEPFWMGELLKPVVTGYTGTDSLYYRFTTDNDDVNDYLNYYSNDTRGKTYNFNSSLTSGEFKGVDTYYFKDEAYAAIFCGNKGIPMTTQPTYIQCSVYTISKGADGKFTATLIAQKKQDLTGTFIYDANEAIDKEFEYSKVIVMQQGDSMSIMDALGMAGFTHLDCKSNFFNNMKTEQYNNQTLSVEAITNGNQDSLITARTDTTGLSKLTFDFYSEICDYHGSAFSQTGQQHYTLYVYVVPKPEFTATANSITVKDNTGKDAKSTYTIGFREPALKFTGLNPTTVYNVLQSLSVEVDGKTYTGIYDNYVLTLPLSKITNATPIDNRETNHGYIAIDKEKADIGDTITVQVYPDDGYTLGSLTYIGTGDETATAITTTKGNDFVFEMPSTDEVTVTASFIPHNHAWSYAVKENDNKTLTAACGNEKCGSTDTALTVSAPALAVYGGSESAEATLSASKLGGCTVSASDIQYFEKKNGVYGDALECAPTAAGDYKASITVGGVTAYVEYTIAPKTINVTAEDKATYIGSELAQLTYTVDEATPLVTGDSLTGSIATTAVKTTVGTYAITVGTLSAGSNYTVHFTNGTYTVKPLETQNLVFAGVTDNAVSKTYGDASYQEVATGNHVSSTVSYESSDTSVATVTADGTVTVLKPGTATITAKAAPTVVYAYAEASYTLTVNKIAVELPTAKTGLVYNASVQTGVELPDGALYTLENNTATNAGTYTAVAKLNDTDYYAWKLATPTSDNQNIQFTIAKKTPVAADFEVTLPTSDTLTYNGVAKTVTASTENTQIGAATVQYFNNGVSADEAKNAGAYTVKLSVAESANYTSALLEDAAWSFTVTPVQLTASGTTVAATRVYNGDTDVTVTNVGAIDNLLAADNGKVTLTAVASVSDKNAGTGKAVTVVYTIQGEAAQNYIKPVNNTSLTTAITAKPLSITVPELSAKEYNGNTEAPISKDNLNTLTGVCQDDDVTVSISTAAYNDKSIGTGKTVTVVYSLSGDDADNYTLANGIINNATIYKKVLSINAPTVQDKTYDGTNLANVTDLKESTLNGMLDGDNVSVSLKSATYSTANAGDAVLTVSYTLSGDDAANYSLADYQKNTTIAKKQLTASGTTVAATRVYNADTDVTVTNVGTIDNLVAADNGKVTLSAVASVSDKNAGTGKAVTVVYTIQGEAAQNYIKPVNNTSLTTAITAKPLSITVPELSAKEYNGNTEAPISKDNLNTLTGVCQDDDVTVSISTAAYDDKDVGTGKTVTVVYSLSGDDAANYTLANGTVNTAVINQKALTIDAPTVQDKTYDGTNLANVTDLKESTLNGIVNSDDVSVSLKSATYSTANAGDAVLTVSYTLSGDDAANYSLADYQKNTTIAKKQLTVTGTTVADKRYDGNVNLTATPGTVTGIITDDTALVSVFANATLDNANHGQNKPVTVTYSLEGTSAIANYIAPVTENTTASVYAFKVTYHENVENGDEHTVTWYSPEDYTLEKNTYIREGYTFNGWAIFANGAVTYKDGAVLKNNTQDLNLFAVWSVKYQELNISEGVDNKVNKDIEVAKVPAAKEEEQNKNAIKGVKDFLKPEVIDAKYNEVSVAEAHSQNTDLDIHNEVELAGAVLENDKLVELDYSVTPWGILTTTVDGVTTISEQFPIENTDYMEEARFAVTLSCAGMKPVSVVHSEGEIVVNVYTQENGMVYDAENQTVTVVVHQFFDIKIYATLKEMPEAQLVRNSVVIDSGSIQDIFAKVIPDDTVRICKDCGNGTPVTVYAPAGFDGMPFDIYVDYQGYTMNADIVEGNDYGVGSEKVTEQLVKYTIFAGSRNITYTTGQYLSIRLEKAYGVEGEFKVVKIDGTVIAGENGLKTSQTIKQTTSHTVSFVVEKQEKCTFDNYKVLVNGTVIYPDGDGVYTVEAGEDDVTVEIQATPEQVEEEELSLWEKIYQKFRSIIQYVLSWFKWGSYSASDNAADSAHDSADIVKGSVG